MLKDGHLVSRISDFIIYSVEAEYIERVVSEFGPCKYRPAQGKTQAYAELCRGNHPGYAMRFSDHVYLFLPIHSPCSNQGRCNRGGPDVRQGS